MITVKDAAKILKMTPRGVVVLIKKKRLPATWFGGWAINESDLESVKERKRGRPPGKPIRGKQRLRSKE